jgi:hypothetical protein
MNKTCEICGREKQMYYELLCMVCEPPEIEHKPVLNMIRAFRHIDAKFYNVVGRNDKSKGYDWTWSKLGDYGMITNDSFVSINFVDMLGDFLADGDIPEYAVEWLGYLIHTFKLYDSTDVLWEISW